MAQAGRAKVDAIRNCSPTEMLTIEDFNALLEDPEYHAIPRDMIKNLDPGEKWWDVVGKHNDICSKMQIWEMANIVAILLEKYPDFVNYVTVEFNEDRCGGGSATLGRFTINNKEFDVGDIVRETAGTVVDFADGAIVWKEVLDYMLDRPTVFMGSVESLKAVFSSPIYSSQQALDLARSALGDMGRRLDAMAQKKALERERVATEKKVDGLSKSPSGVKNESEKPEKSIEVSIKPNASVAPKENPLARKTGNRQSCK